MTPYDPKRPRPRRSTETIAPVDALLDGPDPAEATDSVDPSVDTADSVVDVTDRTVGATPHLSAVPDPVDSAEPADEPEPGESAESVTPTGSADAVEPADPIDETITPPGAAPTASRSETPTAPAPDEGTANRAVLVAGVTVLVAAVVAAVVVWLRRRD